MTQLVEGELYLPQEWFTEAFEEKRKQLAEGLVSPITPRQLPQQRTFQTKAQLGLQMIRRLKENSTLPFSFMACDDAYGSKPDFLKELRL